MALTWKTVKGVTTLTWESPTMGAFWKIDPTMDDDQIAEILTGVVLTLKRVKMDRDRQINELETELGMTPSSPATAPTSRPTPVASPTNGWSMITPDAPTPTVGSATPLAEPPSEAGKIIMMPPSSLSGEPAGGAPSTEGVDWSAMPSTSVPGHLQKAWEMMPPEEATW